MKLGSLFDGIGGFPYSALKYGITPVWASEIEPWPIKVTEKHFPNMKHLGDITEINGAEIEPVDIITFGSPCQGLSLAGKREGLQDERSGLFTEAVRIIREMRASTGNKYPRFAVWENVPGAFSSNKRQDFRAVLEEIAETEIPMPASGKWANAGLVRTATADIAWRVLNAKYWGVPQRRKRIFLVADFTGRCAGEILFIEKGLRGDFTKGGETRKEVAGTVGDSIKKSSTIRMREGCAGGGKGPLISEEKSLTLGTSNDQVLFESHPMVIEPRSANGIPRWNTEGIVNGCGYREGASFTVDTTSNNAVVTSYAVRRLTPLECTRLQGFPDYWLDIEGMSDTQKYRAIGNSVAIPCVDYVMQGVALILEGSE